MTLEIEAKFWVHDPRQLAGNLEKSGWKRTTTEPLMEEDLYFQGVGRDFSATGEALRLRIQDGKLRYTYKGRPEGGDGLVKIRREIELDLTSTEVSEAHDFLVELGFEPIATVRKARREFTHQDIWPNVSLLLDDVEDLGCFVEIEVLAEENGREAACGAINAIALDLGLSLREKRSYLRILLEKMCSNNRGVHAGGS
jgi:adenylate cyclase class 2